jgi:hypothetical protein
VTVNDGNIVIIMRDYGFLDNTTLYKFDAAVFFAGDDTLTTSIPSGSKAGTILVQLPRSLLGVCKCHVPLTSFCRPLDRIHCRQRRGAQRQARVVGQNAQQGDHFQFTNYTVLEMPPLDFSLKTGS